MAQARNGGFTLIEALMTVALLAVLVTLAAPGLNELVRNNRMAAQTNDIMSLFAFARAEAMRRGARITVCPSGNGGSCSGGSDWSVGLIVFVDADRDGMVGVGEEVLRAMPALSGGNTLSPSGGALAFIQFRGSGVAAAPGGVKLCDTRPDKGRSIVIAPTGSIRKTVNESCP